MRKSDTAVDSVGDGTPVMRAFRQSTGRSQHDVAVEIGITEERLAELKQGKRLHLTSSQVFSMI